MKVILFAGTSEGRRVAAFLSENAVSALICVATEYGETVLPEMPNCQIRKGRMDKGEMCALMKERPLVIDATHPYAEIVTQNIKEACRLSGSEYIRLIRPKLAAGEDVITVPDTRHAAAFLAENTGAALVTTGSKELAQFTGVPRFGQRLFVRVLPSAEVLAQCSALGFAGKQVIAMQGPFSREMNVALLRMVNAKYLVTKDSGKAGGFAEKLSAAREAGAKVILIARPNEETGLEEAAVKHLLAERFWLKEKKHPARRFPLFVSLAGRKALIAGAGHVSARRAAVLLSFGAEVHVIAPEMRADFPEGIAFTGRAFIPEDLEGAFLAVAATDNPEINRQIGELCRARSIPCSRADNPEESTFFFPAVCTGGNLTAGIVSDGSAHTAVSKAAARIRKILKEEGERADADN